MDGQYPNYVNITPVTVVTSPGPYGYLETYSTQYHEAYPSPVYNPPAVLSPVGVPSYPTAYRALPTVNPISYQPPIHYGKGEATLSKKSLPRREKLEKLMMEDKDYCVKCERLYRTFSILFRVYGAMESTNEKMINRFLTLRSEDRTFIMAHGSLEGFLVSSEYFEKQDGRIVLKCEVPLSTENCSPEPSDKRCEGGDTYNVRSGSPEMLLNNQGVQKYMRYNDPDTVKYTDQKSDKQNDYQPDHEGNGEQFDDAEEDIPGDEGTEYEAEAELQIYSVSDEEQDVPDKDCSQSLEDAIENWINLHEVEDSYYQAQSSVGADISTDVLSAETSFDDAAASFKDKAAKHGINIQYDANEGKEKSKEIPCDISATSVKNDEESLEEDCQEENLSRCREIPEIVKYTESVESWETSSIPEEVTGEDSLVRDPENLCTSSAEPIGSNIVKNLSNSTSYSCTHGIDSEDRSVPELDGIVSTAPFEDPADPKQNDDDSCGYDEVDGTAAKPISAGNGMGRVVMGVNETACTHDKTSASQRHNPTWSSETDISPGIESISGTGVVTKKLMKSTATDAVSKGCEADTCLEVPTCTPSVNSSNKHQQELSPHAVEFTPTSGKEHLKATRPPRTRLDRLAVTSVSGHDIRGRTDEDDRSASDRPSKKPLTTHQGSQTICNESTVDKQTQATSCPNSVHKESQTGSHYSDLMARATNAEKAVIRLEGQLLLMLLQKEFHESSVESGASGDQNSATFARLKQECTKLKTKVSFRASAIETGITLEQLPDLELWLNVNGIQKYLTVDENPEFIPEKLEKHWMCDTNTSTKFCSNCKNHDLIRREHGTQTSRESDHQTIPSSSDISNSQPKSFENILTEEPLRQQLSPPTAPASSSSVSSSMPVTSRQRTASLSRAQTDFPAVQSREASSAAPPNANSSRAPVSQMSVSVLAGEREVRALPLTAPSVSPQPVSAQTLELTKNAQTLPATTATKPLSTRNTDICDSTDASCAGIGSSAQVSLKGYSPSADKGTCLQSGTDQASDSLMEPQPSSPSPSADDVSEQSVPDASPNENQSPMDATFLMAQVRSKVLRKYPFLIGQPEVLASVVARQTNLLQYYMSAGVTNPNEIDSASAHSQPTTVKAPPGLCTTDPVNLLVSSPTGPATKINNPVVSMPSGPTTNHNKTIDNMTNLSATGNTRNPVVSKPSGSTTNDTSNPAVSIPTGSTTNNTRNPAVSKPTGFTTNNTSNPAVSIPTVFTTNNNRNPAVSMPSGSTTNNTRNPAVSITTGFTTNNTRNPAVSMPTGSTTNNTRNPAVSISTGFTTNNTRNPAVSMPAGPTTDNTRNPGVSMPTGSTTNNTRNPVGNIPTGSTTNNTRNPVVNIPTGSTTHNNKNPVLHMPCGTAANNTNNLNEVKFQGLPSRQLLLNNNPPAHESSASPSSRVNAEIQPNATGITASGRSLHNPVSTTGYPCTPLSAQSTMAATSRSLPKTQENDLSLSRHTCKENLESSSTVSSNSMLLSNDVSSGQANTRLARTELSTMEMEDDFPPLKSTKTTESAANLRRCVSLPASNPLPYQRSNSPNSSVGIDRRTVKSESTPEDAHNVDKSVAPTSVPDTNKTQVGQTSTSEPCRSSNHLLPTPAQQISRMQSAHGANLSYRHGLMPMHLPMSPIWPGFLFQHPQYIRSKSQGLLPPPLMGFPTRRMPEPTLQPFSFPHNLPRNFQFSYTPNPMNPIPHVNSPEQPQMSGTSQQPSCHDQSQTKQSLSQDQGSATTASRPNWRDCVTENLPIFQKNSSSTVNDITTAEKDSRTGNTPSPSPGANSSVSRDSQGELWDDVEDFPKLRTCGYDPKMKLDFGITKSSPQSAKSGAESKSSNIPGLTGPMLEGIKRQAERNRKLSGSASPWTSTSTGTTRTTDRPEGYSSAERKSSSINKAAAADATNPLLNHKTDGISGGYDKMACKVKGADDTNPLLSFGAKGQAVGKADELTNIQLDDTCKPESDEDSEWTQVSKKKKKDPPAAGGQKSKKGAKTPAKPYTPGMNYVPKPSQTTKASNFERLIGILQQRFPQLNRSELISIIQDVRSRKGSLTGMSIEQIVEACRPLIQQKQRQSPVRPSSMLQVEPITPPSANREEGENCVICFEDLSYEPRKKLECGHEFHEKCINTWVFTRERTCPTCRQHALLPEEFPKLGKS